MDVRNLRAGGSAQFVPGEIRIRARPVGGRPDRRPALELVDAVGAAWDGPVQHTGGSLVLLAVPDHLTVAVAADVGSHFPPDTVVQLIVDVTTSDGLALQFRSPERDLSGLRRADVLWLGGDDPDRWSIGAPAAELEPVVEGATSSWRAPPADADDDELVTAGRAAARAEADATRVPGELQRQWVVVLDRSASMLLHQRSGALGCVLRVMLGAAEVFDADGVLQLWHSGTGAGPQPRAGRLAGAEVDDVLADLYAEVTTGLALRPLQAALPPATDARTVFLLTDDLPADLDGSAPDGGHQDWHLVVFGRSRFDFRRGPRGEPGPRTPDDQVRDLPPGAGLRVTSVSEGAVPLPTQLAEQTVARRLVAALARPPIDLRGERPRPTEETW